ncbi:MAG: 3-oxoacyl-[acyl-carrier-protein] reductase [Candidatus Marinimicrobia bacterium]|jgi:3-oxoacyl-[acyl-carrier protein] reductase|nr:3-oxoacyl-[acyl-carrier-protein] reductase [Candidatus Neomarinimicrobiota bacterium]MBT3618616.1 3-oxoacyl-[acyl-carrier-protein] reductase [Candidatus Neomarinimicrobiota bacterium]MBT3829648.1 3-oxoacyl-[acyl-carrier-protein] reductase [Candidatus Neomarinimicrobiota bacterium]MBT3997365.1 3-oxoacyl-[acyl-carrier-protein] reductase [Candidatus Neomarinimicrobiota bacterium]MBT4281054.1 3-oxoacyl-[acyl-carrier-protein] reductase [Candidatus Neomarinimicrobiota bacterium]
MYDLTEKTAIVTGASRGIGKSIAEVLAKYGAQVVCVSRSEDAVNTVATEIQSNGGKAVGMSCDVSDASNVTQLMKDVQTQFQTIDVLINNAGITRDGLIMRMSNEDWETVLDINLKGAYHTIKAVARPMMKQRSGRIINISSIVGLTGNAGQANYAASKAGLIGLTKSMAQELAPRGITVNCIAPGYIETDMTDSLTDNIKENITKQIPLGRIGKPKEVAALALFLSSDEAEYITGQTITVDGGMVMN